MMRSPAYRDFVVRAAEAKLLVGHAIAASTPEEASALAKGAAVLTAASLERYVNDFLGALCRETTFTAWAAMPEGQQQYLTFQIAQRVRGAAAKVASRKSRDVSQGARDKLKRAIMDGHIAFANPSTWAHHRAYGMFMDGAAEPSKLDATLGLFLAGKSGFFDRVAERGRDRSALATALAALIDARHGVAHALVGVAVSPSDTRLWLSLSRILVREIEAVLWCPASATAVGAVATEALLDRSDTGDKS